jgi:putative transcriptional regulator
VQNGCVSSHESPIPGSTKGKLLVATPPLADPNFDRTVVFMLEHTDDGAVGVVINRPTGDGLPEGIERWEERLDEPGVLFEGGPVELDALIALGRVDGDVVDEDDAWTTVVGDIASIDLALDPVLVAGPMQQLRVFRGYSGWGPQQLDAELSEGAWMVLPAETGDVFSHEPDELWRAVIRRQGGRIAWVANAPDDLSSN